MPEEINRVLTDQISDYLFTTERTAFDNLKREGIDDDKIFFVGNVMIDTLRKHEEMAMGRTVLDDIGIDPNEFVLVTLHRPSNVDDKQMFAGIMQSLLQISQRLPVVFPVHPRTRNRIEEFGMSSLIDENDRMRMVDPLGYLDFLKCMREARLVVTDSGGIQEETTVLGVPCITVRENTERPVTVTEGTNTVVGRKSERLLRAAFDALDGRGKAGRVPELWDGKTAQRIVGVLTGR
jgi:UDP-N-acetylglucosamine 2-epimerase (non-hydrolysing)